MKKKTKNQKGFSLMEILIATFIFFLVTVTTVGVFAEAFRARQRTRTIQRDVENARTAIDAIAKEMRMSVGLAGTGTCVSGVCTGVRFYNSSQGICVNYEFDATEKKLMKRTGSGSAPCSSGVSWSSYSPVVSTGNESNEETGFLAIPTITRTDAASLGVLPRVGRATIRIKVDNTDILQTTVSFRDYEDTVQ
jgi:Tfp pilus assembly protein PilW